MSWPLGPMLGFDLETDGVDPTEALPVQFGLTWADLGDFNRNRHGLIDPGRPIDPQATEIHGITDELVRERGGSLEKSLVGIAGFLVEASLANVPIVGCNVVYDLTVIDCCLFRATGEGLADFGFQGPVIDCLVLDRHYDRYRKGSRSLSAMCEHYGVKNESEHSALADAKASVGVSIAIAKKHDALAKMTLAKLFEAQKKWRAEWADHFSEYRLSKGDSPLDPREWDWPIRGRS